MFKYWRCTGWVNQPRHSMSLTNRVINHIKEQVDNKCQVRKHPTNQGIFSINLSFSINLGHTLSYSGDTPRNQLILIYWIYASNVAHESNSLLPNTINKCFTKDYGMLLSVLHHTLSIQSTYLIVREPYAGLLRPSVKELKNWRVKVWRSGWSTI